MNILSKVDKKYKYEEYLNVVERVNSMKLTERNHMTQREMDLIIKDLKKIENMEIKWNKYLDDKLKMYI